MKLLGGISLLLSVMCGGVDALFEDEQGLNDFLIATTGHGVPSFIVESETAVVTSSGSDCTVASRSIESGKLEWRTNVCSSKESSLQTIKRSATNKLFTIDSAQMLRVWTLDTGALIWDTPPGKATNVWCNDKYVITTDDKDNKLTFRSMTNGRELGSTAAKLNNVLSVLTATATDNDGDTTVALTSSGNSFSLQTLLLTDDGLSVSNTKSLSHIKATFEPGSLQIIQRDDNTYYGIALSKDGQSIAHFSILGGETFYQSVSLSQWHPLWTKITGVKPLLDNIIRVTGIDDRYSPIPKQTSALYRFDPTTSLWDQWYGSDEKEESQFDAIDYCSDTIVASVGGNTIVAYKVGAIDTAADGKKLNRGERHRAFSPLTPIQTDITLDSGAVVENLSIVQCDDVIKFMVSTSKQTTHMMILGDVSSSGWTVEDGLQTVDSAILLDAGSHAVDTAEEQQAQAQSLLDPINRIQSQLQSIISPASLLSERSTTREQSFGFDKMAVMLSQSLDKVWGIPTTPGASGWALDLPPNANWHTIIHGTSSQKAVVHGINGGTPHGSHEIMILSSLPSDKNELVWNCVDGISGDIHKTGSISSTSSTVKQLIPLFGGSGDCRQAAMVLQQDGSVAVVPSDEKTVELATNYLESSSKNGFHTHTIDREHALLESFLVSGSKPFRAQPVGQSSFVGETVLGVTYPQRDEVVQSPSSVLGDDSLLLKYLNPHLAVIITTTKTTTDSSSSSNDLLLNALKGSTITSKDGKSTRKPKGVSTGASEPDQTTTTATAAEEVPNLFVNIVDTVSGRILHRTSHSNAATDKPVPALITENWILYAYFNTKSSRTELGVLTLHEGMVDKAGLTAFKSPGQTLSFSSLDPRESKPVVLAKTYTIVKPVTALGVTSTRGGISTRHVLVASADHKITSVKRDLLEPRRPTGDVKDHEKQEGLFQYTPLVPLISMASPSYNLTVSSVTALISTPTALESQSLVLAFGGPDVFFTRLTPSKGFDILPESFNRPLLSIVVVGLLVALFVVRNMSSQKLVKTGWS